MLRTLSIRNYALIEELQVEFERGMNIITGETGAGKSIIIDAMSLVLGERADTAVVRKGAEKAIVEAVFDIAQNRRIHEFLARQEIDGSAEMILRREVSLKGQSRSFINDTPVTIAVLKEAGDMLVDLHGQHEHQSLLNKDTHCALLDGFAGLEGLVHEFGEAYAGVRAIAAEMRDLKEREGQLRERRELYEFQMREIDAVGPRAGEEADLEQELAILENSERLFSATERLYRMLYEGDDAVHDRLIVTRNELDDLASIDRSFGASKAEAAAAAAMVEELAKFIQRYNSKVEFDPERLEAIRERLGQLTLLKKKYGGSIEAIIEHRKRIGDDVALAANFGEGVASLQQRFSDARTSASEIAQRLSSKRHEAARRVSAAIVSTLAELGIARAAFEAQIAHHKAASADGALVKLGKDALEAGPQGIDDVEFFVSTNLGEEVKPLVKVASGGEVSRIMLGLKMILAKSDKLPLLVFDEIDVGISGRIAQAVGLSLRKLSRFHQIIAITHLPQIAGFADAHYVVEKAEAGKRSITRIRRLGAEDRVSEVAKLMSGAEVTEAAMDSARELIGVANGRRTQ